MRINGGLDTKLPVDDVSNFERRSVLEEMDEWIKAWRKKRSGFHEEELNKKRLFTDFVVWESFLGFFKSLDHDTVDVESSEPEEIQVKREWICEKTESELLKMFNCDTWPPSWFQSNESIMSEWRRRFWNWPCSRWLHFFTAVMESVRYVPSCISDILLDIAEKKRYEGDLELARVLSSFLYTLADRGVAGIEEAPGLPVIAWDLAVVLLLLFKDPRLRSIDLQALCRMVKIWPELSELLEGNRKGDCVTTKLDAMITCRSVDREERFLAVTLMIRIEFPIGVRLPVDGRSGKERLMILAKMDEWLDVWMKKEYGRLEAELEKMKGDVRTLCDVGLWESFLGFLRSLDR
jgi:hypothetical protein